MYVKCCIYRYIHENVIIIMFKFREYGFIKWKFKFWNFLSENSQNQYFRSIKTLARLIENGKKIILESLDVLIVIWFLFNWSKRALDWSKGIFDQLKVVKKDFLKNFLVIVQNDWRCFKPCEQFYETF